MLTCPTPSCGAVVGQDMVESLAEEEEDKERYSRYLMRSSIENSKNTKWCPGWIASMPWSFPVEAAPEAMMFAAFVLLVFAGNVWRMLTVQWIVRLWRSGCSRIVLKQRT
jgi:hypothetical protein